MAEKVRKKRRTTIAPAGPAVQRQRDWRISHGALAAIAIFAGFTAYSNTLGVPFQWDGRTYILQNPMVTDLGMMFDLAAARASEFYHMVSSRYVSYLTFALNYKIGGASPIGYRMASIALHMGSIALVYACVTLLMKSPGLRDSDLAHHAKPLALVSAAIFALHPLQSEAVNYIFQRHALLAAFFSLGAMACYLRFRLSDPGARAQLMLWHAASVVLLVLAMKSKESAFTFPLIIALMDVMFFEDTPKRRAYHLAPLLATMIFVPLAVMRQGGAYTLEAYLGPSPERAEYMLTQLRVIVEYLRLFIAPVGLSLDHDVSRYATLGLGLVPFAIVIAALLADGLWMSFGRANADRPHLRLAGFGMLWFFLALSVESSVFVIPMMMAEYRMYLPMAGLVIAVAAPALHYSRRIKNSQAVFIAATLIIVALGGMTYARNITWQSKVALWSDTAAKSPNLPKPHNNLGTAFQEAGKLPEAEEQLKEAIRLQPEYALAHYNLAALYINMGRFIDAEKEAERTLALDPKLGGAHLVLGMARLSQERYQDARMALAEAVTLMPDNAVAHFNFANALAGLKLYGEAVKSLKRAVEIAPNYAKAYLNMGNIHLYNRDYADAEPALRRAAELDPKSALTLNRLGMAQAALGMHEDASESFRKAVGLDPENKEYRQNLEALGAFKK